MLEKDGAEILRLGTAPDDPIQIEMLLKRAVAERVDLIVTSAGVSVGAFDFVRQVIEDKRPAEFLESRTCAQGSRWLLARLRAFP